MKSIKTNPNCAKGPDKGKIVLHIIDNTWVVLIIFFSFSLELRCNATVKIWFGRNKILNYAYVLKNGVGRYNIFFLFLHKACWILLFVSFSHRIRQCFCSIPLFDLCHVLSSSTNNFAHVQMRSRMSSLSGRMNIAWGNIGFFSGFKKIKQWRISFVLGYLRMILWKISTVISIKHRILATFN
jgi:hypothetical protein